jgi:hypothetical protein
MKPGFSILVGLAGSGELGGEPFDRGTALLVRTPLVRLPSAATSRRSAAASPRP